MSNPVRHLYKYAKGHYGHSTSIEKDLRIILGAYCCISAEHITPNDIVYWLCKYVQKHLDETWKLEEFVIRVFRTEGNLESLFSILLVPLALCKTSTLGFELGGNDPDLVAALHTIRLPKDLTIVDEEGNEPT